MPAYYVNWGRYPQLGGQVIFPVAAVLTIKCLGTTKLDYKRLILAALAAGKSPKMTPTPVDTPIARAIEKNDTIVGHPA